MSLHILLESTNITAKLTEQLQTQRAPRQGRWSVNASLTRGQLFSGQGQSRPRAQPKPAELPTAGILVPTVSVNEKDRETERKRERKNERERSPGVGARRGAAGTGLSGILSQPNFPDTHKEAHEMSVYGSKKKSHLTFANTAPGLV